MVSQVEVASVICSSFPRSAELQWCRLAMTGMERRCWQCSGQLMVAERCFPVILSRLKDHEHLTFAIFDESFSPTFVRVWRTDSPYACYVMVWVIPFAQEPNGCSWFSSGFRPVFSSVSFCSQTTCSARLGRQSQEMRFFSSPKTTSVGRLFEGETQALNEEVTLASRWGLRRWRKANLQIVKRYVKLCSSSQWSFFDATTMKRSCRLDFWARKCLKVIDTSTIDSCGSQFRSSHRYARQSG